MRKFTGNHGDNIFIFVDPPYYDAGKVLFRNFFSTEDHVRLEGVLTDIDLPWLVSDDEAGLICELYKSSIYKYEYTDYQAGNLKRGTRELFFPIIESHQLH